MHNVLRHLLAIALIAGTMTPLPAQQPAAGAVRVTLVAGAVPARGGRAEVVRRANRSPQNLVIIDRNATAEDLAAALAMINALRAEHGDNLTADLRARTDKVRLGPTWENSPYRSWLIEQLVRVRNAHERQFGELGLVRTAQITLPAPTGVVTRKGG
jgi:predicted outer membrane lipoprotein